MKPDKIFLKLFALILLVNFSVLLCAAQITPQTPLKIVTNLTAPEEGNPIGFKAAFPSDAGPLFAAASFKWDFGDGTPPESGINRNPVHHVFADEGTYTVTLRITSTNGLVISATEHITIKNVPPRINKLQVSGEVRAGKPVTILSRVRDPGRRDKLIYTWNFGDNTPVQTGKDLRNPKHTFARNGVFTVRLTVKDDDGASVTETLIVTVGQDIEARFSGVVTGHLDGEKSRAEFVLSKSQTPGYCNLAISINTDNEKLSFGGEFNKPLKPGGYTVGSARDRSPGSFVAQDILDCRQRPGADCSSGLIHGQSKSGIVTISSISSKEIRGSFSFLMESNPGNYTWSGGFVASPLSVFKTPVATGEKTGCLDEKGNISVQNYNWKSTDWPEEQEFRQDSLVDYENPEILITLSEKVDLESFFDGFVVEYVDAGKNFIEVTGSLEKKDDHTVIWRPDEDLMDGVRYRASVRGGENGVQGADGEKMDSTLEWWFETLLNLSSEQDSVRPRLYQVVADAPLVRKKPTLARVYLNWKEKKNVHEYYQTRTARFKISVEDAKKSEVYAEQKVEVKRFDLYTGEEKKNGLSSANLWDWRPTGSETSPLIVKVEQIPQDEAEPKTFTENVEFTHFQPSHTLKVDFWYLKVGVWEESISPGFIDQGIRLALKEVPSYVTQNFPVVDTKVTYRGELKIEWPEYDIEIDNINGVDTKFFKIDSSKWQLTDVVIINKFYEEIKDIKRADIVMVIAPEMILPSRDGTLGVTYRMFPAMTELPDWAGLPRVVTLFQPNLGTKQTVSHEFGHSFGLSHTVSGPCSIDEVTLNHIQSCRNSGKSDPIEGYSIDKSGESGSNKSASEGNSDVNETPGSVISMMNKLAIEADLSFILPENYIKLQKAFLSSPLARKEKSGDKELLESTIVAEMIDRKTGPQDPFQFSSSGFNPVIPVDNSGSSETSPADGSLRIRGYVSRDGNAALIEDIRPFRNGSGQTTRGEFEAVLFDSGGKELVKVPFDGRNEINNPNFINQGNAVRFDILVPNMEQARRIEIRNKDGQKLAERKRSSNPPSVRFLSPAAGSKISTEFSLQWEASDADGDTLSYNLYYSPDGAEWTPLLIGGKRPAFKINPEKLEGGPAARFKIIVSDGFNIAEAILELSLGGPLSAPIFIEENSEVGLQKTFTLAFLSPVNIKKDGSSPVHIVAADEKEVPASISLDEDGHRLSITPSEPLNHNTEYRLKIDKNGFSDKSGRQNDKELSWSFRTSAPLQKTTFPQIAPLPEPRLIPVEPRAETTEEAPPTTAKPEPAKTELPPENTDFVKINLGAPLNREIELKPGVSGTAASGICEENKLMSFVFQQINPANSAITQLMLYPETGILPGTAGTYRLGGLNLTFPTPDGPLPVITSGKGELVLQINEVVSGNARLLKGNFSGTVRDLQTGKGISISGSFRTVFSCISGR